MPAMEVNGSPTPLSQQQEDNTTDRITQGVAAILASTIEASVEKAVNAEILLIKWELGEHASRLNEAEKIIPNIEEEIYQAEATEQTQYKTNQYVLQKLEDLYNRSRYSNLHFVGVPESMKPSAISEFQVWTQCIPEALGLPGPCMVEWAYCMGAYSSERTSPLSIIAKYLNYADKATILQKYRQARSLQISQRRKYVK